MSIYDEVTDSSHHPVSSNRPISAENFTHRSQTYVQNYENSSYSALQQYTHSYTPNISSTYYQQSSFNNRPTTLVSSINSSTDSVLFPTIELPVFEYFLNFTQNNQNHNNCYQDSSYYTEFSTIMPLNFSKNQS